MTTTDTARFDSGYGIRVQESNNITVSNCTILNAAKHSVGVLNSDGFVGINLNASSLMPDQGYGGASAFVAYSDQFKLTTPTSSTWINCTVSNVGGDYSAFYDHGIGLGSITIENMNCVGVPILIGGTQYQSKIIGGSIQGSNLTLLGNTVADGVAITGGSSQISVNGAGNIVQNCVVSGGDMHLGYRAVVVDSGDANVYRFNTFVNNDPTSPASASIFAFVGPDSSGTQIYGNIISAQLGFIASWMTNELQLTSNNNLMTGDFVITLKDGTTIDWNQWKASGFDVDSIIGNPGFANGAGSNFGLTAGSYAIGAGELPETEAALDNWLEWNVGPQNYQPGMGMASIVFVPAPEPGTAGLAVLGLAWLMRRRGR